MAVISNPNARDYKELSDRKVRKFTDVLKEVFGDDFVDDNQDTLNAWMQSLGREFHLKKADFDIPDGETTSPLRELAEKIIPTLKPEDDWQVLDASKGIVFKIDDEDAFLVKHDQIKMIGAQTPEKLFNMVYMASRDASFVDAGITIDVRFNPTSGEPITVANADLTPDELYKKVFTQGSVQYMNSISGDTKQITVHNPITDAELQQLMDQDPEKKRAIIKAITEANQYLQSINAPDSDADISIGRADSAEMGDAANDATINDPNAEPQGTEAGRFYATIQEDIDRAIDPDAPVTIVMFNDNYERTKYFLALEDINAVRVDNGLPPADMYDKRFDLDASGNPTLDAQAIADWNAIRQEALEADARAASMKQDLGIPTQTAMTPTMVIDHVKQAIDQDTDRVNDTGVINMHFEDSYIRTFHNLALQEINAERAQDGNAPLTFKDDKYPAHENNQAGIDPIAFKDWQIMGGPVAAPTAPEVNVSPATADWTQSALDSLNGTTSFGATSARDMNATAQQTVASPTTAKATAAEPETIDPKKLTPQQALDNVERMMESVSDDGKLATKPSGIHNITMCSMALNFVNSANGTEARFPGISDKPKLDYAAHKAWREFEKAGAGETTEPVNAPTVAATAVSYSVEITPPEQSAFQNAAKATVTTGSSSTTDKGEQIKDVMGGMGDAITELGRIMEQKDAEARAKRGGSNGSTPRTPPP